MQPVYRFALALTLLLSISPVMATTYHVSTDGSDTHPGTADQPFATIQHAVDQAQPGDTVQIGPGVFHEFVVITQSGRQDAAITIQGTRGPEGQRLTRIDGSRSVDPQTWEPAFDMGPNVYRNASFDQEPQLLMVDGLYVAHVHRSKRKAIEMLAWPEDHRQATLYVSRNHEDVTIPFWQTMGGIYAHNPDPQVGITYLRLADGADPRDHDVAVSDGGAIVTIDNASHIVLRGLAISGGHIGIQIRGQNAQHNVIDDCFITHCNRSRVEITQGAGHNTVQNCHMTMGFWGFRYLARTGAWAGGSDQQAAIREYLYNHLKYLHGPGTISDDRSVRIGSGAHDTRIIGNHLDGGLVGIAMSQTTGVEIRDNRIENCSSVGFAVREKSLDVHIVNNTIANNSINIRLHLLNHPQGGHRVFIRGNRLYQPGSVGTHIFCHALRDIEEHPEPEVTFYHNTFVGGARGWALPSSHMMPDGTPGFRFFNNVFASSRPYQGHFVLLENPQAVGAFDYNWVGGDLYRGIPAWFGDHNIIASDEYPWDASEQPDFLLPAGHPARGGGIDLSQPFHINGQTYEALPGLTDYYLPGQQPDMGAVQHPAGS